MKKIDRNVVSLGWVSLFTDLSSEMIFPILPTFMADVLGIPKFLIGIIEGVAESTASLLKVFSGYISDRLKKRKPIVFVGYTLSTFTKPLLAFAYSWHPVLLLRFLDRVGKGIRTSPRDALIADYSIEKTRGRAFGFHRSMDNLGAVIGTLAAFALMTWFTENPFRRIFLISFIPASIAVFIIVFFVKERKPDDNSDRVEIKGFSQFDERFRYFLIAAGIFAFSNMSYAFFLLRAEDIGVEARYLPLVYLVYNISYLIFSYPAGILSDRIGRKKVISLGYITYTITALSFAFAGSTGIVWLLFALYGLFHAFVEGVSRAFVSDLVPSNKRATAIGLYHTTVGIIALPAGAFAGGIWDLLGPEFMFFFAAFLSALALVILSIKVS